MSDFVPNFRFDPIVLPSAARELRREVRAFLARHRKRHPAERRANSWGVFDAEFSRLLGQRGWIGMSWPKQYGGQERSAIERYVLLEELLAAGAPVGAHWVADRQSGPTLLRFGSETQNRRYLPGMARGELFCCIGMSEPNAGSDLASVRTRAEQLPDGRWRLNGQKIWTTFAQHAHLMIALVRTGPYDEQRKHAGLSQFLIELSSPGVRVRPIVDLAGSEHFNEVFFEDVILGPECLIGVEGDGWRQVGSELSLERSGPERYLSSLALFLELVRLARRTASEMLVQTIGQLTAQFWTLRQMSLSIAAQLASGADPALEAAIVKDLGASLEQSLPTLAQAVLDDGVRLEEDSDLARTLALLLQTAPSFSVRGGTREILRGIVARGLGLR